MEGNTLINEKILKLLKQHLEELEQDYQDTPLRSGGFGSSGIDYHTLKKLKAEISDKDTKSAYNHILDIINAKGKSVSDIYNNANVSKAVFGNFKKTGKMSKGNLIALCLALELENKEIEEALKLAGYSYKNDTLGKAVSFLVDRKIREVDDVNLYLYACDLPLIGSQVRE